MFENIEESQNDDGINGNKMVPHKIIENMLYRAKINQTNTKIALFL